MKEEMMIGRLRSRTGILIESAMALVLLVCFYVMIMKIFAIWSYFAINPQAYEQCQIFMAVMFILAFIFMFSIYGGKQVMKIDQHYFYYCSNIGLLSHYRQVFRILMGKDMNYEVQVKLSDIEFVSLGYSDIAFRLYYKGHSMIFNLVLKDGTMLKIQPDNLYFEKKNFLKGIEYLENMGVVVKDPYHLKDALKDNGLRFAEYIDRMKDHER